MIRGKTLKRLGTVVVWILLFQINLAAQEQFSQPADGRGFVVRVHRDDAGKLHKYVLFIPHGYTPDRKWPAILYLHGAGECGTDGMRPTTLGIGPYVKAREADFPFFVLFPQCEDTSGRILTRWSPESDDSKRAIRILDSIQQEFSIDPGKISLTGWSMGGHGAWEHLLATPEKWSSVVTIAGGLDDHKKLEPGTLKILQKSHIWALHGKLDNFVHAEESRAVVETLKKGGVPLTYSEFPQGDHGIWRQVYESDQFYSWLQNPAVPPNQDAILSASLSSIVPPAPFGPNLVSEPFINALYIPRAITARLGNDMLAAVSDAVPGMVPAETLAGQLGDMYDSTSASGRSFSVTMSGIQYSAKLHRVLVESKSGGEVSMMVGFEKIDMVIGGTYISGGPRSASAGPISITVGTQEPVWLMVRVKPRIEAGKIRLDLVRSDFTIPDNNWAYSSPGGISTRGLGMTEDRVYDGIMSGMAGSKPRIESQVKSLVPSVLQQFEERFEFSQFDQLIAGIWPLPMGMPRVLTWPQEISVDSNGITLVLGATVAASTEAQKKAKPRWAKKSTLPKLDLSRERSLHIGINPEILEPISEMAVEAENSVINVLDTPSRSMASLSDRETMSRLIPALGKMPPDVDLNSELILRKPLKFKTASAESASDSGPPPRNSTRLKIEVPELLVRVSTRLPKEKKWTPLAELVMSLEQFAQVSLGETDFRTRALQMSWEDSPKVTASSRFVQQPDLGDKSIQTDPWSELVVNGWREFTDTGHAARFVIPDVQVGIARLRASKLQGDAGLLGVAFAPPTLRLANRTENPLSFQVKSPSSNWSKPLVLKPGSRTGFKTPTDMLIRFRSGEKELLFNLPAGSSSAYRVAKKGASASLYSESDEQAQTGTLETNLERSAPPPPP